MRPAFQRLLGACLLALLLIATFGPAHPVTAQGGSVAPIQRDNDQSTIGQAGHRPNAVLGAAANPLFVGSGSAIPVAMFYRCVNGNADGSTTPDPNCVQGEGVSSKTVTLRYTLDGSDPTTNTTAKTVALQGATIDPNNAGLFSGSIPRAEVDSVPNGGQIAFTVTISTQFADCRQHGGTADGQCTIVDPPDVSGQTSYLVRVDRSAPLLEVTAAPGTAAKKNTDHNWLLYSPGAGTTPNKAPPITITTKDNSSGATLNEPASLFFREDRADGTLADQTGRFRPPTVNEPYRATYSYTTSGDFPIGTATRIDVDVRDRAGNRIDTRTATEPALWVVVDKEKPTVVDAVLRGRGDGLVGAGTNVTVYANATDEAGTIQNGTTLMTPAKILDVFATLRAGTVDDFEDGNTSEESPAYKLPWDATCPCYTSNTVTLPSTWQTSGVVHANIEVFDPIANGNVSNAEGTVSIDLSAPSLEPLSPLIGDNLTGFSPDTRVEFKVRATDPGDSDAWQAAQTQDTDKLGIEQDSVKVFYTVGSGAERNAVLAPRTAEDTYSITRTFNPTDLVTYHFEAEDIAGNKVRFPTAGKARLQVDQAGPTVEPIGTLDFIGPSSTFNVKATDAGSGVDKASGKLFFREQGASVFNEVPMTGVERTGNNTTGPFVEFSASLPLSGQKDGAQIQYYVTVRDKLNNAGSLGSIASPRTTLFDSSPPGNVTFDVDSTVNTARFTLQWEAKDNLGAGAGSGVDTYQIQFRIGSGGQWVSLPALTGTTATTFDFCALAQKTYEFRGAATDKAGNAASMPSAAQTSTFVAAQTSCAEAPSIELTAPASGASVTGPVTIGWTAGSTTFPPEDLVYDVAIGRGGTFTTVGADLQDVLEFTWDSRPGRAADICKEDGSYAIRVTVEDPNEQTASATVNQIQLQNGISDCRTRDLDGNGLPDDWEFAHFGSLGVDPNDDADGDGATNLAEFQAGTNPQDAQSRPAANNGGPGTSNPPTSGDDGTGWNGWYVLVVLAFAGIMVAYVVGITRRW